MGIKKVYPRRFYNQITLLMSVIIVGVFLAFGSLTAKRQTEFLQDTMKENAVKMTESLAESCARYLLISDYAGLDELLDRFLSMSGSLRIQVSRADGKVLSEVGREAETSPPARLSDDLMVEGPDGTTGKITVVGDRMTIVKPVISVNVIGWAAITYSLKNINQMRWRIWIETAIAAICWTCIGIVVFMIIFRRFAGAVQKLSYFARNLGNLKGEQIHIPHSPYEIQQLCQSLNYTSADLYAKEEELKSHRENLETLVATRTAELQEEIEERRKTEEILHESEEKFSLAFRQAPVMTSITTLEDGTYLEVNEKFLKVSGFSRWDLLGKTCTEVGWMRGEDRDRLVETLQKQGKVSEMEIICRARNGRPVVSLYHCELVTIGGIRRVLTMALDITERKQAEKEREKLEAQLRHAQKLEAIGTLAGGIAHDFNNILGAILGYTEMALDAVPENTTPREDLDQVLLATHRAKELVKQILAFSRQGEILARRPVEIAPIIEEALSLLRSTLPTTIEMRQHIPANPMWLRGDPTQLHQIIVNLCTNAAHSMREKGGLLDLTIEEMEVNGSHADAYENLRPGSYIQLIVRDTGHGMGADTLERIFDPYFTTKEVGEGSGLGLAVVDGIVRRHEGGILVHSEPGSGTRFEILLPMIEGPQQRAEDDLRPIAGGSERILFVDDEVPLAVLGERMLLRLGYRVTTRTSSIEAIELFRSEPDAFDLVITDYMMPYMTGVDLAKEMFEVRPDIRVILCTGYSETVREEILEKLGIRKFLMKPFELRNLAESVRKVLEIKMSS